MPSTSRGAVSRYEGIYVDGLIELQRALKRAEGDTGNRLRGELRDVAKDVRGTARAYVTHKTGRHGGSGIALGPSIRSGATTKGASIYSNAPHAIVQDVGGRVGNSAILRRADVSHYMSSAVQDSQPYVSRRVEGMLDELERNFER